MVICQAWRNVPLKPFKGWMVFAYGRESGRKPSAKENALKAYRAFLKSEWRPRRPTITVLYDQGTSPSKARTLKAIFDLVRHGTKVILAVKSIDRLAHDWQFGRSIKELLSPRRFRIFVDGIPIRTDLAFDYLLLQHVGPHKRKITRQLARRLASPPRKRQGHFFRVENGKHLFDTQNFRRYVLPMFDALDLIDPKRQHPKKTVARLVSDWLNVNGFKPFRAWRYAPDLVRMQLFSGNWPKAVAAWRKGRDLPIHFRHRSISFRR